MRRTIITCDCCGRELDQHQGSRLVFASSVGGGQFGPDNPLIYLDGSKGDSSQRSLEWTDTCALCQRVLSDAMFKAVDGIRAASTARVFDLPKQHLADIS